MSCAAMKVKHGRNKKYIKLSSHFHLLEGCSLKYKIKNLLTLLVLGMKGFLYRKDSPAYVFFEFDDKLNCAICKSCRRKIRFIIGQTSTSNLLSHLKRRHQESFEIYRNLKNH